MIRWLLCLFLFCASFAKAEYAPVYSPATTNQLILQYGTLFGSNQYNSLIAIQNPKDSTKLIGVFEGLETNLIISKIGLAYAFTNAPLVWYTNTANPVLTGSAFWESNFVRVDSFFYDAPNDQYVLYYTAGNTSISNAVGRATSPTGTDGYSTVSFTKDSHNPILTAAQGPRTDESHVSQLAVFQASPTAYYGYYSYRLKTGVTLPGIRIATSADGISWTKQSSGDLFIPQITNSFFEFHTISKVGNTYVMLGENGLNEGVRWTTMVACSLNLTNSWAIQDINTCNQNQWPYYIGDPFFNVATPCFLVLNGATYFYYCSTFGPVSNYNTSHWSIRGITDTRPVSLLGATIMFPPATTQSIGTSSFSGTGFLTNSATDQGNIWIPGQSIDASDTISLNGGAYGSGSQSGAAVAMAMWNPPNETATITVSKGTISGTPIAGLFLRGSQNFGGYSCRYQEGTGYIVYQWVAGTPSQVGSSVAGTMANGDTLTASVSGVGATVTITMKKNGTQVLSVTDTSGGRIVVPGFVGIELYNPGGTSTGNYKITAFTAN